MPAYNSGLEDLLGHGSVAPSDGTSSLLMAAQFSGAGAPAERVAMESVDHICLSRAPHMKYKYLLANGAHTKDRALEHFRREAIRTDSPLTRAVANGREFF